ncbi:MAG: hypothetical protein V4496_02250 [Pseudomonadota bacterium]
MQGDRRNSNPPISSEQAAQESSERRSSYLNVSDLMRLESGNDCEEAVKSHETGRLTLSQEILESVVFRQIDFYISSREQGSKLNKDEHCFPGLQKHRLTWKALTNVSDPSAFYIKLLKLYHVCVADLPHAEATATLEALEKTEKKSPLIFKRHFENKSKKPTQNNYLFDLMAAMYQLQNVVFKSYMNDIHNLRRQLIAQQEENDAADVSADIEYKAEKQKRKQELVNYKTSQEGVIQGLEQRKSQALAKLSFEYTPRNFLERQLVGSYTKHYTQALADLERVKRACLAKHFTLDNAGVSYKDKDFTDYVEYRRRLQDFETSDQFMNYKHEEKVNDNYIQQLQKAIADKGRQVNDTLVFFGESLVKEKAKRNADLKSLMNKQKKLIKSAVRQNPVTELPRLALKGMEQELLESSGDQFPSHWLDLILSGLDDFYEAVMKGEFAYTFTPGTMISSEVSAEKFPVMLLVNAPKFSEWFMAYHAAKTDSHVLKAREDDKKAVLRKIFLEKIKTPKNLNALNVLLGKEFPIYSAAPKKDGEIVLEDDEVNEQGVQKESEASNTKSVARDAEKAMKMREDSGKALKYFHVRHHVDPLSKTFSNLELVQLCIAFSGSEVLPSTDFSLLPSEKNRYAEYTKIARHSIALIKKEISDKESSPAVNYWRTMMAVMHDRDSLQYFLKQDATNPLYGVLLRSGAIKENDFSFMQGEDNLRAKFALERLYGSLSQEKSITLESIEHACAFLSHLKGKLEIPACENADAFQQAMSARKETELDLLVIVSFADSIFARYKEYVRLSTPKKRSSFTSALFGSKEEVMPIELPDYLRPHLEAAQAYQTTYQQRKNYPSLPVSAEPVSCENTLLELHEENRLKNESAASEKKLSVDVSKEPKTTRPALEENVTSMRSKTPPPLPFPSDSAVSVEASSKGDGYSKDMLSSDKLEVSTVVLAKPAASPVQRQPAPPPPVTVKVGVSEISSKKSVSPSPSDSKVGEEQYLQDVNSLSAPRQSEKPVEPEPSADLVKRATTPPAPPPPPAPPLANVKPSSNDAAVKRPPPPPPHARPSSTADVQVALKKQITFDEAESSTTVEEAVISSGQPSLVRPAPPPPPPPPPPAGVSAGQKPLAPVETAKAEVQPSSNHDNGVQSSTALSVLPLSFLDAIKKGAPQLKTVNLEEVGQERDKQEKVRRASAVTGFNASSITALLERRKFLEVEESSDSDEEEDAWDVDLPDEKTVKKSPSRDAVSGGGLFPPSASNSDDEADVKSRLTPRSSSSD